LVTIRDETAPKAELVERVRRFVADEVAPRAAGIDRENAFPGDVYRRMGEERLLGLARPHGAGKSTLEWAVWIEELAASATVADIVCSADLLAGETVGAFALTEAQAGSNAAAIETVARGRSLRPQGQEGLDHLRAGARYTTESAMAKLRASDVAAMRVTVEALQIHGASGYSKDLPLERFVRDAKLTQIYEGTNQIQREVLARQLLG
jgi:alkylation response protein AidB-like acyl-CoA dehydrogenase